MLPFTTSPAPDAKGFGAIERLWNAQVDMLGDARSKNAISRDEYEQAIQLFRDQRASMEHHLAQAGIRMDLGGGAFWPMRPGVIGFDPARRALLERAYAAGELEAGPGGSLIGRLGGEMFVYVPRAAR